VSGCLLWLLVGGRLVSLSRSRTEDQIRKTAGARASEWAGPSGSAKIHQYPNPNCRASNMEIMEINRCPFSRLPTDSR
jgi:hypothetical protein